MKHFAILLVSPLFLTACTGSSENPDENFDQFYQGSPQQFRTSAENQNPETPDFTQGFTFSGGNEQMQCSVTCAPISE